MERDFLKKLQTYGFKVFEQKTSERFSTSDIIKFGLCDESIYVCKKV